MRKVKKRRSRERKIEKQGGIYGIQRWRNVMSGACVYGRRGVECLAD
jgi:hypothetical protein